ncbi:MAG: LysM peptidoglycan-binding domain-containing protein, partial [Cytophagaceae bacterium]
MGLLDFLTNEGDKKPVEPAKPAAGGASADFFGNSSNSATSTTGESYTVASGDTLSKIAKNHYGDGAKWHQIYEANKA